MKNKENLINNSSTTLLEMNDTELDLYPDLLLDNSDGSLTVVIHHDYYSSDSDHGRILLRSFMEVLKDEFSKISKIFILDSGVCLLDKDNELNDIFQELCKLDFDIVVCKESIENFKIDTASYLGIRFLSMHEISLELLSAPYLFNLG